MLLGIGNELNGDDGIGSYIAKRFNKRNWLSVDCSTVPENYISVVKRTKPEFLVIVDAAYMNLPPGTIRRLEKTCTLHIRKHTHCSTNGIYLID